MLATSFTTQRIELVRLQQDLTIDIVRAADAIAIYAETLQQATLSEQPLDTIAASGPPHPPPPGAPAGGAGDPRLAPRRGRLAFANGARSMITVSLGKSMRTDEDRDIEWRVGRAASGLHEATVTRVQRGQR
jgi:hypothetical protein